MQSLPRGWLIVGLGLAGWAAVIAIVVLISSLGATAAPMSRAVLQDTGVQTAQSWSCQPQRLALAVAIARYSGRNR